MNLVSRCLRASGGRVVLLLQLVAMALLLGAKSRAQSPIFEAVRPGTGNWLTVQDGNFESLGGPLLVSNAYITQGYWYLFTSVGTTGTAAATDVAAYRGLRGIQIRPGINSGPGIALTLGRTYTLASQAPHVLSGWVRRSTNTSPSANVYLDLWGAVGGFKVVTAARPGWQFVYGTFTPGFAPVGIRCVLDGVVSSTEEVWVDELAITPASQFSPPSPSLGLFNVRLGTKDSESISGPAAYGESPSDFWNLYSRDGVAGGFRTLGSVVPLVNASGAQTMAGLTIANAPGAWGSGHPNPLMSTYLYPLGGGSRITLTLTNLPTGTYDLFLYGHGGPGDAYNTAFSVSSGEMFVGTKSTSITPAWMQTNWVEGQQYVRFSDVFVSSGQPLLIYADPGLGGLACVNGLQVARTSEQRFRVWPDSSDYTNSLRVAAMSDPRVQVRFGVASDPTTNSPSLNDGFELTSAVTLRIQAFEGTQPVSPVITRTYRRIYVFDARIPREWRVRFFGEDFAIRPEAANDADPDADGSTNLQEYRASTDPRDPLDGFESSVRLVPAVSWTSVSGSTYRVMRKDRLTDTGWTEVGRVLATGIRSEYVDPTVTDVPRFYRIEVVR